MRKIILSGLIVLVSSMVAYSQVQEQLPYLTDLYRQLHQNPEISLQEEETSALMAKELLKAGFEVTENVGGNGVVGVLRNGEGPVILYRTDMDALPLTEKTGLDYASEKTIQLNGSETGVMHACGHDIHMSTWVGTARIMADSKVDWNGTLVFIAQPAEEVGKGAEQMLTAGLYEKFPVPDYILGLHSSAELPAGKIGVAPGFTMANTEMLEIEVYGQGGHGAAPHQAIDPVLLSSMIVMDLHTIVSRNVEPTLDAVLTVGAIQGGTVGNIIPDQVNLKLTLRTFEEETRALIHQRMREICRGTAMAAGLPEAKFPKVTIPEDYIPANYNDPQLTQSFRSSAAKVVGEANIQAIKPKMVGEDFALYSRTEHKIPAVMYWLGTVPVKKMETEEDLPGLHSPFYYPDPDQSIATGIKVNRQVMLDWLGRK